MKIPHSVLRSEITISNYLGATARGPAYASVRTVRALVNPTSRLVTDVSGRELVAEAVILIRPESGPVPIESHVTYIGGTFRVITALPIPDDRRPNHIEMTVTRVAA